MHPNETGPFQVGRKAYQLTISDHILDNVYGQVGITLVEKELERLPIFKRLHHVSQLGLVNWIFPCALHTRYIHSVGVMYVAGEMASHINKNYRGPKQPFFDDSDIQIIRLAGLLHDIGHYPMSHNIEEAYKNASNSWRRKEDSLKTPLDRLEEITKYPSSILEPEDEPPRTEEERKNIKLKSEEKFFSAYKGSTGHHHENMGSLIICNNESIQQAILWNFVLLEENGKAVLNPKFAEGKSVVTLEEATKITSDLLNAIGAMVRGDYDFDARTRSDMTWLDTYSAMIQLIHSELDADNLDYLLRDATFSGTSYGTMDMSVLLNCLTVTELKSSIEDEAIKTSEKFKVGGIEVAKRPAKQYIVGIMPKGVGSVDQFLLNKYLAYTQMILSKYVTILEEMLSRFEIDYVLEEEEENHTNYACKGLMNLVAEENPSMPYYWFSDQYILQKISAYQSKAKAFSKLPKAIITRLGNLSAFNLYDKTSSECICSGCTDESIRKAIGNSPVYKRFLECRKKLKAVESSGRRISQEERAAEELELFSYHFTVYSLTKQVPINIFSKQFSLPNMSPDRRFAAHYYRLANGVPIIEDSREYSYNSFPEDSKNPNGAITEVSYLPNLCVDSPQSCLHEMYSLRHVTLRQYRIE